MSSRMTRREFGKGLLAAGALACGTGRTSALGANERINVAIIGCRNRGAELAGDYTHIGGFNVVTFCDCDEAMIDHGLRSLAEHPIETRRLPTVPKREKDFRRVLDDREIDAVAIATPDHWHAIMTILALQAGKHVLLEKPASYCIEEGKAMVAAARKYPKQVLCVGTQQRSGQHFADARAFIAEGGLGRIGFVRAFCTHHRPLIPIVPDSDPPDGLDYHMWLGPAPLRPYNVQRVHYNWHFMRDTGTNDTGNWGAHWLDSTRHLLDLDLPTRVHGVAGRFIHDAKEWPDTQTVIFEFPQFTVLWEMRLWTRFGLHGRFGGIEINGEKGSLLIDRGGWVFYPHAGAEPGKPGEPVVHPTSDMAYAHAVNFRECIRGQARPAASIEDGHRSACLCHLANICCLVGRSIRFDPATQTILDDPEAAALMTRPYRAPWELPKL